MCVILFQFTLISAVCLVIGVFSAPRVPILPLHVTPANSKHEEPGRSILRTEDLNILKVFIKNPNDKMDNTEEASDIIMRFCIFCLQPPHRDSTDCKRHCKNVNVKQEEIISTGDDKIIKPKGDIVNTKRKIISPQRKVTSAGHKKNISTKEGEIVSTNRDVISSERKLISTKKLRVKDDISIGTGGKGILVITDALCAFCKLYPMYQQTDFCQQKVCASTSLPI